VGEKEKTIERTLDCRRHDTTGKTPAVFQKRVNPSPQK